MWRFCIYLDTLNNKYWRASELYLQAIITKCKKKIYVGATLSQVKIGPKNHIREHNHKIKLLMSYVFVKCTKLCSAVSFMTECEMCGNRSSSVHVLYEILFVKSAIKNKGEYFVRRKFHIGKIINPITKTTIMIRNATSKNYDSSRNPVR